MECCGGGVPLRAVRYGARRETGPPAVSAWCRLRGSPARARRCSLPGRSRRERRRVAAARRRYGRSRDFWLVCLFFFVQGLAQEPAGLPHAELVSPSNQGSVSRDLVVLHGLRRRKHTRVVNLTVLDLLHDALGFRQNSIHRIAAHGSRVHSTLIENSLQAFNLMVGLFAVFFEGAFEILGLRALSHLRQVFIDLLFGVRVGPKSSLTQTKLSEHETNRGEAEKSECVSGEIFEILGQAATAIEPREGALDNPASRQRLKPFGVIGAFDDFDFEVRQKFG